MGFCRLCYITAQHSLLSLAIGHALTSVRSHRPIALSTSLHVVTVYAGRRTVLWISLLRKVFPVVVLVLDIEGVNMPWEVA